MNLLQAKKLLFALTHFRCWRAARRLTFPSIEHRDVLQAISPDLVIDVGGNRGQFALACRYFLPGIPVVSFEPIPSEADIFEWIFAGDANVTLHRVALGESPGLAQIHLSQQRDSSSLLPIGEAQTRFFPDTKEVGVLQVPVHILDSLDAVWSECQRALLKLDVQGFELSVLRGSQSALRSCAYVYCECSEIELYRGQALSREIKDFLAGHGFHPTRHLNDTRAGSQLIQADYLFERPPQRA